MGTPVSNNRYDLQTIETPPMDRKITKLLYVTTAKHGGDWNSMMHTHACAELFYVVGGSGQFKIGELVRPVSADDMLIVNPNVEHTEVSLNQNPLEYIVLGVEGLEFSAEEGVDDGRYCMVNFHNSREEVLHTLRNLLSEIEHKAKNYQIVCQDLLEVLLIRLMRRNDFPLKPAAPQRRTTRECAAVRRYIDSHFKENITLEQLASITHINKYHMVHSFSKEYGISPINYLISRRIEESRCLLSDTDHTLSEISHMLGFSSPSYFSQSFRRLENLSPMEYRKQNRR